MTSPHSRPGASEALLGSSSRDFGGRPASTSAFEDEDRAGGIDIALALAALAWLAPVVLFNLLVG